MKLKDYKKKEKHVYRAMFYKKNIYVIKYGDDPEVYILADNSIDALRLYYDNNIYIMLENVTLSVYQVMKDHDVIQWFNNSTRMKANTLYLDDCIRYNLLYDVKVDLTKDLLEWEILKV